MTAEHIYDILHGGVGASWPLTIGDLPATHDIAVCITEYDGATGTEYFGNTPGNSIFAPIIKCVVRHSSYKTGQAWSDAIAGALHRYHDNTLLSVLLIGAPMYLGRSEEKLHEFQITFQINIKE